MGLCASISSGLIRRHQSRFAIGFIQVYNNWGFIHSIESLIPLTLFHPQFYPLHHENSGDIIEITHRLHREVHSHSLPLPSSISHPEAHIIHLYQSDIPLSLLIVWFLVLAWGAAVSQLQVERLTLRVWSSERGWVWACQSGTPPSWEERTHLHVPENGQFRSKETTQAGGFWCNCCVWEYRNGCCKH